MAAYPIRILVVDDYEPFRRFLTSTLQQRSDLQIIGEVSDGLEAVRKAEELQPELIVLDIGLPILNGIEAATRIRSCSPLAKILFVSQQTSTEIVQAAFGTGAQGYVAKTDAGRELMAAVDAVLGGGTYVSRRLWEHGFGQSLASGAMSRNQFLTPKGPPNIESKGRHEAVFCSEDRILLDKVTQFVGAALTVGNAAIVIATESHRDNLLAMLHAYGADVDTLIEQDRYVALDVADTLSSFLVNGTLDPVRFMEGFGYLIQTAINAAKGNHPRVAFFGEGAHLLWTQGNVQAAIQDEKLCNELTKRYDVDILCGYRLASFQGGTGNHVFEQLSSEHSTFRFG